MPDSSTPSTLANCIVTPILMKRLLFPRERVDESGIRELMNICYCVWYLKRFQWADSAECLIIWYDIVGATGFFSFWLFGISQSQASVNSKVIIGLLASR